MSEDFTYQMAITVQPPGSTSDLCIAGEHDLAIPPAAVRDMADAILASEYVELENTGHLPCIEQGAAFCDAALEFLGRHVR